MSADSSAENQPVAPDAAPAEAAAERPSQRIQIGSQRETAVAEEPPQPKPVMPVKAAQPKKEAEALSAAEHPRSAFARARGRVPGGGRRDVVRRLDAVGDGRRAADGDWHPRRASPAASPRFTATTCSSTCRAAARAWCRCDNSRRRRPRARSSSWSSRKFNADEGLYELSRPNVAVEVGNWEDVHEGQIVDVTVTGSNKGGLECQIAGLRGFIPLGQLSMYRVEHPEDYVGQRLACVVTEANRDRRNLVLSHRAVMEREREEKRGKLLEELAPGQLREGIVRSIKDFGAFVDLDGVDGLIHVSQLSWDRVNHPSEVLEVGQKVKVRVEKFDKDTGKISLSYREVGENPWEKAASKYYVGARVQRRGVAADGFWCVREARAGRRRPRFTYRSWRTTACGGRATW